jgi:hypothetical protein
VGTSPAWQFRFASVAAQAVLWTLLGFGYAALMDRRTQVTSPPESAAA